VNWTFSTKSLGNSSIFTAIIPEMLDFPPPIYLEKIYRATRFPNLTMGLQCARIGLTEREIKRRGINQREKQNESEVE
jgi:hypothetical protein